MKKLYTTIINFLFKHYFGTDTFRLFGRQYNVPKASKFIFSFLVLWGLVKIYREEAYFTLLDILFTFLFVIQYLAAFTNIIKDEYDRIIRNS